MIQEIRKCGDGIEVVVNDTAYFFNLNDFVTKDDLVTLITKKINQPLDKTSEVRINNLKLQLENTPVAINTP